MVEPSKVKRPVELPIVVGPLPAKLLIVSALAPVSQSEVATAVRFNAPALVRFISPEVTVEKFKVPDVLVQEEAPPLITVTTPVVLPIVVEKVPGATLIVVVPRISVVPLTKTEAAGLPRFKVVAVP